MTMRECCNRAFSAVGDFAGQLSVCDDITEADRAVALANIHRAAELMGVASAILVKYPIDKPLPE